MIVEKNIKFPFSRELEILFKIINQNDSLRIVGGAVRDFLSNREIHDIDLACKFKPEKTKKLLQNAGLRVIDTGIKHGTVTAIVNSKSFEITTLRNDVENYGRKAKVEFVDDFRSDAQRRDFTINAMSIDGYGNLFDYFGGLKDLKDKKVRFIGDVKSRIEEDYLRILRFFRFSSRYADEIDELALKEVILLRSNLNNLSSHRIRSELIKIIQCNNDVGLLKILKIMNDNQIIREILLFDDFNLTFLNNLCNFSKLLSQECDILLKFCALIYSHKDDVIKITNRLDFSNKEKRYISNTITLSSQINLLTKKHQVFRLLFNFQSDVVLDALKLNIASLDDFNEANLNKFLDLKDLINNTILPKFILNGDDLKNLGVNPKDIGKILKASKDFWIDSDFKASKQELLDMFC